MITFPPEFVATRLPGYFWHTVECKLYSIKVTGELRPLAFRRANKWNYYRSGYEVSHKGGRSFLTLEYLSRLHSQVIPIQPVKAPQ